MDSATPPTCSNSLLKEPSRSSMWVTAPVRSVMCCTAPPINVRDSAISLPAAEAACCESFAARSISRLPDTMASAALELLGFVGDPVGDFLEIAGHIGQLHSEGADARGQLVHQRRVIVAAH